MITNHQGAGGGRIHICIFDIIYIYIYIYIYYVGYYIYIYIYILCRLLCIFFECKGSTSLPESSIVDGIYSLKFEKTHEATVQTWNRLISAITNIIYHNYFFKNIIIAMIISVFCSIIFIK